MAEDGARQRTAAPEGFGGRAAMLAQMSARGVPVPPSVALDPDAVARVLDGAPLPRLPGDVGAFLALRTTVPQEGMGHPPSILNLGVTDATVAALAERIGVAGALEAYRRLIRDYGVRVAGIDPEDFENLLYDQMKLTETLGEAELRSLVAASLSLYQDETDENFPQTLEAQVRGALRAMSAEWNAPTARILRDARGGAGVRMGVILQRMVFGLGAEAGAGSFQLVDSAEGRAWATGRYLPDAQGLDARRGVRTPHMISRTEREAAGQSRPRWRRWTPSFSPG